MIDAFHWLYGLLGASQLHWWLFHLALATCFISLVALWDRRTLEQGRAGREVFLLFLVYATTIAAMWLPNYPRSELNPDESQWIAQANNLLADPQLWWNYFFVSNWARVLTIMPLSAVGALSGGALGYAGARLAGAVMWAGVAVCLFVAVREFLSRRTALWTSALFVLFAGSFGFSDFVAYNSELAVVLLCMGAFALVAKSASDAGRASCAYAAGVLIGAVPFAKDQGLPIAAVLGVGALALLASRMKWKKAALLIAGGLSVLLLLLLLLLLTGNLGEWLAMARVSGDYAQSGTHWASSGLRNTLRFFRDIFTKSELRALLLAALVSLPLLSFAWRAGLWKPGRTQLAVALWAAALFAAAAAAVAYPAQNFMHYAILLVFPASVLLAFLADAVRGGRGVAPWVMAAVVLLIFVLPMRKRHAHGGVAELAECFPNRTENLLSKRIRDISAPGDRMLIWGWRNSYFVETGLLQGSRWMYPVFAIGTYSTRGDNLRRYVEDLDVLRPRFLLEWVGDDAFYFNGPRAVRMADMPEIARRVSDRYELVLVDGNQKLYRLRAEVPATAL